MPRNNYAVSSPEYRTAQPLQYEAQAMPRSAQSSAKAPSPTQDSAAQPSLRKLLTAGIMSYLALGGPSSALAAPTSGRRMLANTAPPPHTPALAPAPAPQACDALYQHLGSNTQPATPSFVDCDLTLQPAIGTPQAEDARPGDVQPVYTYDRAPTTQLYGPRGPLITDVNQGEIGDCTMRAVQAAYGLARPELVQQRVQQAWRPNIYNVTLTNPQTHKDEPHYVNSAFPTLPDGALAFGNNYPPRIVDYSPSNLVTWSMAQEKAAAQGIGPWQGRAPSYVDIIVGDSLSMTDVGLIMFGETMSVTDVASYGQDDAALLQSLTNASMAGVPTIASTTSGDATDGIVADHAYTLLGTTADGKILARNPWSTTNPAGVLDRLYMLNSTANGTVNVMDRGFMAITPQTFRNNYMQIYRGSQGNTPGPMPSLVDTQYKLVHKGNANNTLSNPMDFDYGWQGNLAQGPNQG